MTVSVGEPLNVAIACGGTGGHLFPGLAVAGQLACRGVQVTLMVSPKEVDQLALKTAEHASFVTLPAVGLSRGNLYSFFRGFLQSYRASAKWFAQHPPQAALAMGGFTSAPPILAAKRLKAATFLHESNSIPGRANRWLSWVVDRAFVGFSSAAQRLHNRHVSTTGTPVRPKFRPLDPAECRIALGLDANRPVALVMGGSQGAHGINELVRKSLAALAQRGPDWQWFHLSGPTDVAPLKSAYQSAGLQAAVHPFFAEMDLVMGAATACLSRAGASSMAELAAVRLPSILIPYPAATDNHQLHNARAFEKSGAARLLYQATADSDALTRSFTELMIDPSVRKTMQAALAGWHAPQAAAQIAQAILDSVNERARPSQVVRAANKDTREDRKTHCRVISDSAREPFGGAVFGKERRA